MIKLHHYPTFVGVDDAIVEGISVGATGWIAGLANALPRESVELFNLAIHGEHERAFELYRWFLPLLRMDTVPKFIQLIKLVQAEVGMGNARVRPPRLELAGEELHNAKQLIRDVLQTRPQTISSTVHSTKQFAHVSVQNGISVTQKAPATSLG